MHENKQKRQQKKKVNCKAMDVFGNLFNTKKKIDCPPILENDDHKIMFLDQKCWSDI
jgi:hypothetical protein